MYHSEVNLRVFEEFNSTITVHVTEDGRNNKHYVFFKSSNTLLLMFNPLVPRGH